MMLEYMVGRCHVSTPVREVVDQIMARLLTPLSPKERKALRAKIARIHRRNIRLYNHVMWHR